MITLAIIFSALALGIIARKQQQLLAQEKFEHKLYALRDKLRRLAIEKKVDSNEKIFDFLDLTLSQLIMNSYDITIAYTIFNRNYNKDNKQLQELKAEITELINTNAHYKSIMKGIRRSMDEYFKDQHRVTSVILYVPYKSISFLRKKIHNLRYDVKQAFIFNPDMPAMRNYC